MRLQAREIRMERKRVNIATATCRETAPAITSNGLLQLNHAANGGINSSRQKMQVLPQFNHHNTDIALSDQAQLQGLEALKASIPKPSRHQDQPQLQSASSL